MSAYTIRRTAQGYVVALILCGRHQRTYLVPDHAQAMAIGQAWAN